jgi:DNA polymerase III delta subunit
MSTFGDFWRNHTGEKARARRLYWICGPEEVLRLTALEMVRGLVAAEPYNVLTVSTRDTSTPEIWAGLNQYPMSSDHRRLYVEHEAQALKDLAPLEAWLKDPSTTRGKNTTAVFMSSAPDWEGDTKETVARSSSAFYVRCALPQNEEDRMKRAQEIVCRWGNIDRTVAGVLLQRVNFNLYEARAVMQKAALFPQSRVTVAAVQQLAPLRVEEDIIWSLLALNRRKAAEAVAVGEANVSNVIGALSTHVETLGRMNPLMATGRISLREVCRRTKIKEQYARRLASYARLYPSDEVIRRTRLLERMDTAWQSGAREGVLESLIAQW